jgi:flavin reductase (DIM6/NTAB) family NADH-FMN oxidoreductase RutF
MHFDVARLAPGTAYRLLTSTVVPRPIAWITTAAEDGSVNAAPYSFFNALGGAPPVVAVGMMRDPARGLKDTAENILATAEFVVNLVPDALAEAMNLTSIDAPRGVDETALAGLATLPSVHVRPPRIAGVPAAMECSLQAAVTTGPRQVLAIGRVLAFHIDDAFVLDAARGHLDTPAMGLIGRMHGAGWYARTTDRFRMDRPSWADRQRDGGGGGG